MIKRCFWVDHRWSEGCTNGFANACSVARIQHVSLHLPLPKLIKVRPPCMFYWYIQRCARMSKMTGIDACIKLFMVWFGKYYLLRLLQVERLWHETVCSSIQHYSHLPNCFPIFSLQSFSTCSPIQTKTYAHGTTPTCKDTEAARNFASYLQDARMPMRDSANEGDRGWQARDRAMYQRHRRATSVHTDAHWGWMLKS